MSSPVTLLRSPEHFFVIYTQFDILLSFSQIFGFATVILTGFFHEIANVGLQWNECKGNQSCVNYHGMFMTFAFVFFQGEALLSYRIYRHETKIISKVVHTAFHLSAIVLIIFGIIAIVRYKDNNSIEHMYSFHSWIGVALLSMFFIQFGFGASMYWCPPVPGDVRQSFKSIHRAIGLTTFGMGVAQTLIGQMVMLMQTDQLALMQNETFNEYKRLSRPYLVQNFNALSIMLYGALVFYLVAPRRWRRREIPDELKIE